MTVVNSTPSRLRFRRSGAVWLAAILTLVFSVPFAGSVFIELGGLPQMFLIPVAAVLLLIPLAIAVWSLRSGVDVNSSGLTVKALLGSRHYDWNAIQGFDARASQVYALLKNNRRLPLPAVRQADLPQLIAVGGEELAVAEDETEAESDQ